MKKYALSSDKFAYIFLPEKGVVELYTIETAHDGPYNTRVSWRLKKIDRKDINELRELYRSLKDKGYRCANHS